MGEVCPEYLLSYDLLSMTKAFYYLRTYPVGSIVSILKRSTITGCSRYIENKTTMKIMPHP